MIASPGNYRYQCTNRRCWQLFYRTKCKGRRHSDRCINKSPRGSPSKAGVAGEVIKKQMKQLETNIQNLQHEAFHLCLGRLLTVLVIVVVRGFLCLVVLVIVAPVHLIYYVSPILSRLLVQIVFKGKFALFRFGRITIQNEKTYLQQTNIFGRPTVRATIT